MYDRVFIVAMQDTYKVKFHYVDKHGKQTERVIHPLVLFCYTDREGGTYEYVIGFCELDCALRTFRLDRMSEVTLLDEHFPVTPMDIREYLSAPSDGFSGFYLPKVRLLKWVEGSITLPQKPVAASAQPVQRPPLGTYIGPQAAEQESPGCLRILLIGALFLLVWYLLSR